MIPVIYFSQFVHGVNAVDIDGKMQQLKYKVSIENIVPEDTFFKSMIRSGNPFVLL